LIQSLIIFCYFNVVFDDIAWKYPYSGIFIQRDLSDIQVYFFIVVRYCFGTYSIRTRTKDSCFSFEINIAIRNWRYSLWKKIAIKPVIV